MNDQQTNLQALKDIVESFVQKRDWAQFHSPKNLAMSISIEAAELMEIFQWLTNEEAWNVNENPETFNHLKEEIADVMIYCLSLANRLDIDVAEAISSKVAKNEKRFPTK